MTAISLTSLRLRPCVNESLTLPGNSNFVRLLRVEADADDGSQIRGSLKVVDLEAHPKYAALSYVRGTNSTIPDTILCDEKAVEVNTNCWSALWHLRKALGSFDIWVDVICIDQHDEAEKLKQIPLMGSIYAQANPVYIWLGPEANNSDQVMEYLDVAGFRDWSSSSLAFPTQIRSWMPAVHSIRTRSKQKPDSRRPIYEPVLSVMHSIHQLPTAADLASFLNREWMNRIWTLQEAVLAASPVICCGTRLLSWASFMRSIVYLDYIDRDFNLVIPEVALPKWRNLIGLWLFLHHNTASADLFRKAEEPLDLLSHHYFKPYVRTLSRIFRYYLLVKIIIVLLMLSLVGGMLGASVYFYRRKLGTHGDLAVFAFFLVIFTAILSAAALVFSFIFLSSKSTKSLRGRSTIREAVASEIIRRNTLDPRDKYLGVYVLLCRLGIDLRRPDQFMSRWDLYRELFLALVTWGVSPDVMVCAPGHNENNVPSWIPDFNVGAYDMQHAVPYLLVGQSLYMKATSPVALEERPNLVQPISTPSGPGIVISARRVGKMDWRCQSFGISKATTAKTLCEFLLKVLEMKSRVPSSMKQQRNLRSTKRPKNMYRYEYRSSQGTGRSYRARASHFDKVQTHHMGHANDDLGRWTQRLWNATHFRPSQVWHQFGDEVRGLTPFIRSGSLPPFITWKPGGSYEPIDPVRHAVRTLFVTDQGLMGVGPQQAQIGDDIVLVRGVRMPLIMRSVGVGDCYRLIGNAEVEGMMAGQVWPNDNVDEMECITII